MKVSLKNNETGVFGVGGLGVLLIELTTQLQGGGAILETIHQALANSKDMIQFCNDSVAKEIEEEEF